MQSFYNESCPTTGVFIQCYIWHLEVFLITLLVMHYPFC